MGFLRRIGETSVLGVVGLGAAVFVVFTALWIVLLIAAAISLVF
jgi:hypothetical protein